MAAASCRDAPSRTSACAATTPLKSASPVPIGCCLNTADLADTVSTALLTANFSQVTPGWEMKMGAIVRDDGSFAFDAADLLADFAGQHQLDLHGHTLVWYKHEPAAFARLAADPAAFAALYRRYIVDVVGRYRGRARGWDVVNEPIGHDGTGLRPSLWSQVLGAEDYILRAFDHAAEAAPETPRFINDYDLEQPGKRATFLRLVERLLARGAKIDGIGTQTHIDVDLPEGALTAAISELATLGLPVHVSELDISFGHRRLDLRSTGTRREIQAARAAEVSAAFLRLPAPQRYALTLWGVRDRDSWLRAPPFPAGVDQPLPFDDAGRPKPMLCAMLDAFGGRSGSPGGATPG